MACASTSASLWPSNPTSCGISTPPRIHLRPAAKRWTSIPIPTRFIRFRSLPYPCTRSHAEKSRGDDFFHNPPSHANHAIDLRLWPRDHALDEHPPDKVSGRVVIQGKAIRQLAVGNKAEQRRAALLFPVVMRTN